MPRESFLDRTSLETKLTFLRILAPLEDMSDSESTGGSIPYANKDEEQQEPKDADNAASGGEEGEEEEGV